MHRKKKIIIVSHCILNQNSVVHPLARAKGAYTAIVKRILDNEIGLIQLPCPELLHLGEDRPPTTREEYDTPEFRSLCKTLLHNPMMQIKEYQHHGYEILGILGINESPTCSLLKERGILMDEFKSALDDLKITLPVLGVPTDYLEGIDHESFFQALDDFLQV
jgi:predicted secreted protein